MKPVRGMRDFLPERAKKKQYITGICRSVFERYGFEPLETPVVEEFGLLAKKGSGGEAIKDEIYYFRDKGGRELGLRFDLTVPLARVVATNPQLQKPFRRYAIGRVYRYDRPQASRYREFTQADFDVVGSKSVLVEFECIAVMAEIMGKLGADFYIKINDKRLLEEIALEAGVKNEQLKECLKSLDKLDKIGEEGVKKELEAKGIGTGILKKLKEGFPKYSKMESASQINEVLELLEGTGMEKFVRVDLNLARGLEYYTGMVFELVSGKGPSIGGGGRYDRLAGLYGAGEVPAAGFSFGIDRILDVLEGDIGYTPNTQLFVFCIGKTRKEGLAIAGKAREEGINTEIDVMERSVSKNLNYANKKGIPLVAIIGEREIKEGKVTVKDMKTGKEETSAPDDIGKTAKKMLGI
jgi:histidyl-tRNA synthetase